MKRILVRALCLVLFASVVGCANGQADTSVRVSLGSPGDANGAGYFHDRLSPAGEWIDDPTYGSCWTPYDMPEDWRPYSDGRWVYTDYGWSWASNESWGWATYHYGRWFFDDRYGWVWVPGSEWAPAWVAWRYGDDYVGWAALPPTARWSASAGLRFADAGRIPSHEWCFVPRRHMLDDNVRMQVTSVARNPTMIARSRDATRFEARNGRPANVGLGVAQAGMLVGRRVAVERIVDVGSPERGGRSLAGGVGFYRPAVRPSPTTQARASMARRPALPAQDMRQQQAAQQRRLEYDLNTEHQRLARDQQNELRTRARQPGLDAVRAQHAAEQQAFQAHAAQQRQVLVQRMQKQIMRPAQRPNPGDRQAPAARPDRGNRPGAPVDRQSERGSR